jgi:hypothetical protein
MKQIIISAIFIYIFCLPAFAQTTDPDCPSISVIGPSHGVPLGKPIKFVADIGKGVEKYDVQYFREISSGKLVSGQGTKTIVVLEEQGENVTAALEVKGLPRKCLFTAYETSIPHDPPYPILTDKFDSFGGSGTKARLDNFFIELQNDKYAEGIIVFGNDSGLLRKIKLVLDNVRFRHFSPERLTIAVSDDAGQLTRFYCLPLGAELNSLSDDLVIKLEDVEKLQKIFQPAKSKVRK